MGNGEFLDVLRELVLKEESGAELGSWSDDARALKKTAFDQCSSVSIWENFLSFYLLDYDFRLTDKEFQRKQLDAVKEYIRYHGGTI